ncbi:hypothetical protein [Pseudoalteromonas sp. SR44-2]|uniref:hypothetical protein n=1 Tax=Pseudoalteromonas sp. SR44-2 TaxID=2760937 RepID=UPI001600B724|nr:hypothetical protein [Pseudoalteromonas sp. SR44-2]MBB1337828.1 hypothetical protein [Pseudoalteromonas sp. SR44-2]
MKVAQKKAKNQSSSLYVRILNSLENKNYRYRTIHGISKETGLPETQIISIIEKHSNDVVQLYRTDKAGHRLYSTRKKYNKTAGISEKVMGVFLNRVY